MVLGKWLFIPNLFRNNTVYAHKIHESLYIDSFVYVCLKFAIMLLVHKCHKCHTQDNMSQIPTCHRDFMPWQEKYDSSITCWRIKQSHALWAEKIKFHNVSEPVTIMTVNCQLERSKHSANLHPKQTNTVIFVSSFFSNISVSSMQYRPVNLNGDYYHGHAHIQRFCFKSIQENTQIKLFFWKARCIF